MITKEDCRLLYNIYSQIETTEEIISNLETLIEENGGKVPDIMDSDYKTYGSIEISIPTFEQGKFKCGSARVYKIRYDAAIKYAVKVYKNQTENLTANIDNCILVFPIEEVRDKFAEAFRDLIEEAKELL